VAETIKEVHASVSEARAKHALSVVGSAKRLQFQQLIWTKGEAGLTPAATYTETAAPVPGVPAAELENEAVMNTLKRYPNLFKIVMPLKSDELGVLLENHPNQALVGSLIDGVRHGFWPYADTSPLTLQDNGVVEHNFHFDEPTLDFLRSQRDLEISLDRYSHTFGHDLLPGMVCQPIFAIPKPGSQNLRLINDHSAGSKSLNSLILAEGGFLKLDTL
jgi:hypothetical protein